jgi:DNA mismatch repair ATPase MutS
MDAQTAPPSPVCSILYPDPAPGREVPDQPAYFSDLNLDQVVAAVTAGYEDANLAPFFHSPLTDPDAIRYRQEVFRDLENDGVARIVGVFLHRMRSTRDMLARAAKLYYPLQQRRLSLDAASDYCAAMAGFARDLADADLRSRGFHVFRDFMAGYASSASFTALRDEAEAVYAGLGTIRYSLHIEGSRIEARRYEGEGDYCAEVLGTFEKFKRGAAKSYLVDIPDRTEMNHVEAAILDMVATLYPDEFAALDVFCARHGDFLDPTVAAFDREVQFYVATLAHIRPLRQAGLSFCYPEVSTGKEVTSEDGFDLALAHKLVGEKLPVIPNSFKLDGRERIAVVSGPNQGGKTTFARAFGQLHHFGSLGCPVPGTAARLFLFDRIFTHFERREDIRTLRSKLEDDLVRIHAILDAATPDSLIILNEIFASTTLHDAVLLGRKVVNRIRELDALCVCVTFLVELAEGDTVASLVSTVDPEDPARRTFKIVRGFADGLAYAQAIAAKYRLTYGALKRRLGS